MDDPELVERLRVTGEAIIEGVSREVPGWVVRSVDRIIDAWGRLTDLEADTARTSAQRVGPLVVTRVAHELNALFALDSAAQRGTPLQVVRTAYREPTVLLGEFGIPEVERDSFDARMTPDDIYDLAPRSLADLGDPEMGPLLLAWGLTKSRVLRNRS